LLGQAALHQWVEGLLEQAELFQWGIGQAMLLHSPHTHRKWDASNLTTTTIPKKACFPASNAGKKLIEKYQEINPKKACFPASHAGKKLIEEYQEINPEKSLLSCQQRREEAKLRSTKRSTGVMLVGDRLRDYTVGLTPGTTSITNSPHNPALQVCCTTQHYNTDGRPQAGLRFFRPITRPWAK
jgi:hypothetical protein